MGVLTVDEGGEPRAFRISEGTLSLGSGEEMDLQLSAEEVALYHADLSCEDESLFVAPQPGVMPPTIHGVALKKKTRLGPGQELRVGKAKLTWAPEGSAVAAPKVARPSAGTSAGTSMGASTARRKPAGRSSGSRRTRSSRRSHSSHSSKGVPGWLIIVGILAAAGFGFFFFSESMTGSNEVAATASAKFHLRKAEELIANLNADAAQENLDKIVRSTLSAAELARIEVVEEGISRERAEIARIEQEELGKKWFRKYVGDFEERYLSGDPEPPKVRYFLELCADFRRRWPTHTRLDWVERQERRFGSTIKLTDPLTYDDVMWRADYLTSGRPRDYRTAFALLDEYSGRTENSIERVGIPNKIAELEAERALFHREQLKEAHDEYDKGQVGRATDRLVQLIMKLGDSAMEDEAAEIFIKFPEIEGVLKGYREFRPEDFEAISKNRVIAGYLVKAGLD